VFDEKIVESGHRSTQPGIIAVLPGKTPGFHLMILQTRQHLGVSKISYFIRRYIPRAQSSYDVHCQPPLMSSNSVLPKSGQGYHSSIASPERRGCRFFMMRTPQFSAPRKQAALWVHSSAHCALNRKTQPVAINALKATGENRKEFNESCRDKSTRRSSVGGHPGTYVRRR
jgi:hypothetical protein